MKTLIVYGSRYGCTQRCAGLLEARLAGEVTLHNVSESDEVDLDQFEQVVIGTPIYMGRILPQVSRFCQQHHDQLLQKPLAVFVCCGFPDKAEAQLHSAFSQELLAHARFKDTFGYALNFEKMSFLDRLIVRMVSKEKSSQSRIDEDKINALAALMNEK
ncbi:MAG TPA: flavodoxin [Firmicutes bacterium]|mgnify:CR=1 FL=1|nr:flavodoxin [Bacillota bacterium]